MFYADKREMHSHYRFSPSFGICSKWGFIWFWGDQRPTNDINKRKGIKSFFWGMIHLFFDNRADTSIVVDSGNERAYSIRRRGEAISIARFYKSR